MILIELTDRPDISEHVSILRFVELNVSSRGPFDPNIGLLSFGEHIIVACLGINGWIENGDEFHALLVKVVDIFG